MQVEMDRILMCATLASVLPYVAVAVVEWLMRRCSAHRFGANAPKR